MANGLGLVMVKSNAEIDAEMAAEAEDNTPIVFDQLGAYVDRLWQAARDAKQTIETEMLDNLRQRNGQYSPTKLEQIRQTGGSEVFMMLSNVKGRAAESWLRDILLPQTSDRPFSVAPTPVPSIPPEIMDAIRQQVGLEAQEAIQMGLYPTIAEMRSRMEQVQEDIKEAAMQQAKRRAKGMEDKIDDILLEGMWYDEMEGLITDVVTQHSGFMKGPIFRKQKKLRWMQAYDGSVKPHAVDELMPYFYSPNAFDIYPSPDSTGPEDGYYFERIKFTRDALYKMIGVPGYREASIRAVLEEFTGFDMNLNHDDERDRLEGRPFEQRQVQHKIDALEFWGNIPGRMLIDWGMERDQVPDENAEYAVTLTKVRNHIIRVVMNPDPMDRRPLLSASFERVKGAFWGQSLMMLISDLQDICNASARNLVNNMGIASGPQAEVDVDRLAEGENVTSMFPWKIWQTQTSEYNRAGARDPAIKFYQPNTNADVLMKVFDFYSGLADEYSGIPPYTYGFGAPAGGAGSTASGLSMQMNAAARGIKRVVGNIDKCTQGTVDRVFTFIMMYDPDESIKLDAAIKATGSSTLIQKEQQAMRRIELLQATANPMDFEIMGPRGRAAQLREVFRANEMTDEELVPSEEEMRKKEMLMAQAMAGPPGIPEAAPNVEPRAQDPAGGPQGGRDANLQAQ